MTQKRVSFDFDVEFSNGGSLQGQGFRLDITGDDIDDEALAACLIRDLRLLMVGSVRIRRKQVLEEPHKRPIETVQVGLPHEQARLIDLSHPIEKGLITYKGLPAPVICDHLSRESSRQHYAAGTEFQIDRIEMVGNTGTYLDTPFHRYAHGDDLAALQLSQIANRPGIVIRAAGALDRAIDWTHFAPFDLADKAVLIHTGWDRHWKTDSYFDGHPFLTEKAAIYVRDHGAALVGIDSLNIDDTSGGARPVHSVLLAAGIPIIEHMTRLNDLPVSGFLFNATPPKIVKMGTFPVRAYARLE